MRAFYCEQQMKPIESIYTVAIVLWEFEEYFTVIAEKATKHIADNKTRNSPHSGWVNVPSSASMYLQKCRFI